MKEQSSISMTLKYRRNKSSWICHIQVSQKITKVRMLTLNLCAHYPPPTIARRNSFLKIHKVYLIIKYFHHGNDVLLVTLSEVEDWLSSEDCCNSSLFPLCSYGLMLILYYCIFFFWQMLTWIPRKEFFCLCKLRKDKQEHSIVKETSVVLWAPLCPESYLVCLCKVEVKK